MRLPNQAPAVGRRVSTVAQASRVSASCDYWCLAKCIGVSGVTCILSHLSCGTNPICWATACGPAAFACFQQCC